jgi:hypothetical protein
MTKSKKIETLTDQQQAMFSVYRDKWLKIALNTEAIDFSRAQEAVALVYTQQGLAAPSKFYYARGPHDAWKIFKTIRPNENKNDFLNNQIGVYLDASWLSFYSYFQEVCGINLDTINGLVACSQECGMVWVSEHEAIIQERALAIRFDDQKRLHCENGPAIEYMDGMVVYAWHGVRLDRSRWHWIKDKTKLTAKEALTQENLELRRTACEILGWVHVLEELDSTVIDQDQDPMIGTLLEVTIPDVGKENFLRVRCGTGREFAIPVPPTVKTALEANAWTFGIEPNQLRDLEIRT